MAENAQDSLGSPVLDAWIEAFRGPLIGLLASWRSDWRTAEELAQDTFAEAWVGIGRFRGDPCDLDVVGPWLRGIAFRLHLAARRNARRGGDEITDAVAEGLAAPTQPSDERRELLARAFEQLSAAHQTVLRMHYLEETGTREVAALLGITPKAVEGRLYQARKALREAVVRIGDPTQVQGATT